jgi:F-type H+-transporting ATPase subunit a
MSWLVTGLLIVGATLFRKKVMMIPGRLQGAVEVVLGGAYDFMADMFHSRERAMKYFAFVATLFLFILFNNWFGILPVLGSLGINEVTEHGTVFVPLFRSAMSDLNFTLILAVAAVFMVQVFGIMALGFIKYAHKFFVNPFKDFIGSFVGILELFSEISKMISFSFRLFGNIFAGEVLLIIISTLAPYGAPLPFLGLEIFVGLVQALVFAMLTLVFIQIATVDHH